MGGMPGATTSRSSPRRTTLGLLHSIFEFAIRRGWTSLEPVQARGAATSTSDPDMRFLDRRRAGRAAARGTRDDLGRVDRVIYLAAAMTGLRQGELLALRWRDVDWSARRVRVRRNYVRGEFGTPKSRRCSRSVPLAEGRRRA